jgi:hypothetical protein
VNPFDFVALLERNARETSFGGEKLQAESSARINTAGKLW